MLLSTVSSPGNFSFLVLLLLDKLSNGSGNEKKVVLTLICFCAGISALLNADGNNDVLKKHPGGYPFLKCTRRFWLVTGVVQLNQITFQSMILRCA